MPNYIPLHDAIDNMIPLIPMDYVDRDLVVGLLEGKKQESIDNVKTQKILRKETEKQILGVYLTPLQPTNPWVNDVARAFYETVPF